MIRILIYILISYFIYSIIKTIMKTYSLRNKMKQKSEFPYEEKDISKKAKIVKEKRLDKDQ